MWEECQNIQKIIAFAAYKLFCFWILAGLHPKNFGVVAELRLGIV